MEERVKARAGRAKNNESNNKRGMEERIARNSSIGQYTNGLENRILNIYTHLKTD
jgi:hypothetical protein